MTCPYLRPSFPETVVPTSFPLDKTLYTLSPCAYVFPGWPRHFPPLGFTSALGSLLFLFVYLCQQSAWLVSRFC
ncbi:hypothetical protein L209DRAFT_311396 [Thermothelomyces heterothallicus CBS 203.75]